MNLLLPVVRTTITITILLTISSSANHVDHHGDIIIWILPMAIDSGTIVPTTSDHRPAWLRDHAA